MVSSEQEGRKKLKKIEEWLNKVICGNSLDVLRQFPNECIDCVVTSPPYWGLRQYEGADTTYYSSEIAKYCKHEWEEIIKRKERGGLGESSWERPSREHSPGNKAQSSFFCKKCNSWKGQLGLEPDPDLYIEHLIQIFREVKRVLKRTGTCWVVINDTYGGSRGGSGQYHPSPHGFQFSLKVGWDPKITPPQAYVKPKCLCMIPERFALAMINDGWWLRNKICWIKPNHMPESVKDRFTNTWEYVYFFTKSKKYFFDLDAIREPLSSETLPRMERTAKLMKRIGLPITPKNKYYQKLLDGSINEVGQAGILTGRFLNPKANTGENNKEPYKQNNPHRSQPHPLGKNPGDTWIINTQPFPEAHFAVFPMELCVKPILAGCPAEVCKYCGKPRERITKVIGRTVTEAMRVAGCNSEGEYHGYEQKDYDSAMAQKSSETKRRILKSMSEVKATVGWTDCSCKGNDKYRPGVVLDPFCGSGTTLVVAKKLGRNYIGIDISEKYCDMARRRLSEVPEKLSRWM